MSGFHHDKWNLIFELLFLMKTVICKLAHVCPFLFADNNRRLHLHPFICSPLRAREKGPCSLMVRAPRTNSLLQKPGPASQTEPLERSGPCAGVCVLTSSSTATCVPFKSTLGALRAGCAGQMPQGSPTGLHTQEIRRHPLTWVGLVIL